MLSVVFTALGCQYFVFSSQTDVDKKAGVEAVGVLLLLLNMLFVAVMIAKIVKAGRAEVQKVVKWLTDKLQLLRQNSRVFAHTKARRWRGTRSFTSRDVAMTLSMQQSTGLAALVPERANEDSARK